MIEREGPEVIGQAKRLVPALLVIAVLAVAGCSSSTPVAKSTRLPILAPTVVKEQFNPLEPHSCVVSGSTVAAQGSFNDALLSAPLDQHGRYVNLYVYVDGWTLLNPSAGQLADLSTEHPSPIPKVSQATWRVTATLKNGVSTRGVTCIVVVQSTPGSPLITSSPA